MQADIPVRFDRRKLPRMVNTFIVWRAGKSVDWMCSYSDLVAETGLCRATVISICEEKSWQPQMGEDESLVAVDDILNGARVDDAGNRVEFVTIHTEQGSRQIPRTRAGRIER